MNHIGSVLVTQSNLLTLSFTRLREIYYRMAVSHNILQKFRASVTRSFWI